MISFNTKIIFFFSVLFLLFGLIQVQPVDAVTKKIGDTASISVTCSDTDGNLSQCNITSPVTKNCSASGSSGSCSDTFTCSTTGNYNVCGQAVDAKGLTDSKCLDTVVCEPSDTTSPSGTLSVSPNIAKPNTPIAVAVSANDDGGLIRIAAYFTGSWKYCRCDNYQPDPNCSFKSNDVFLSDRIASKSCSNTWTTSESVEGNYLYVVDLMDAADNASLWVCNGDARSTCNSDCLALGYQGGHNYSEASFCTTNKCACYQGGPPLPVKVVIDGALPIIAINTLTNQWYAANPLLDVDFSDGTALNDGFYQVDSHTGAWTAIFTSNAGTSYNTDFRIADAAWNGFSDGSSHTIYFKTTDDAGNAAGADGSKSLVIKKDVSAPNTAVQCNSAVCSVNWYAVNIQINLSCSDSYSGCDKTYYCQDQINACSPATVYTGNFSITANGTNYVKFYAKDNAQNQEAAKSQIIKLDKASPQVVSFISDRTLLNIAQPNVTFNWSISDSGGSQLKQAELWRRVVGAGWPAGPLATTSASGSSFSGTFINTPATDAQYEYGLHAVDNVGNWGVEPATIIVTVNFTPPPPPPPPPPPVNQPPGSPTFSSPTETWNSCSLQATSKVTLFWQYSDPENNPQDAYQVLVDNNPGFSSPEIDSCLSPEPNTCLSGNSSQSYTPITALGWGTTYNWKVKVKDNQGNWSNWSGSRSFTTPSHAYPWIDFSWLPALPSPNELIQFSSASTTYYGGSSGLSWAWDFGDSTATSTQNPNHSYLTAGTYSVKLGVCDNSNYCCTGANSRQKSLQISLPLPVWKEISPF